MTTFRRRIDYVFQMICAELNLNKLKVCVSVIGGSKSRGSIRTGDMFADQKVKFRKGWKLPFVFVIGFRDKNGHIISLCTTTSTENGGENVDTWNGSETTLLQKYLVGNAYEYVPWNFIITTDLPT